LKEEEVPVFQSSSFGCCSQKQPGFLGINKGGFFSLCLFLGLLVIWGWFWFF